MAHLIVYTMYTGFINIVQANVGGETEHQDALNHVGTDHSTGTDNHEFLVSKKSHWIIIFRGLLLAKTCFADSPAFSLPHPGGFGDIASRRSGHQRAKITNYFYTTRYFVPFFSQTRQFLTTFATGDSEKHTFGGE